MISSEDADLVLDDIFGLGFRERDDVEDFDYNYKCNVN